MIMNPQLAILLSDGVDSTVVVHLLCQQDCLPVFYYIKIGLDSDD